MGQIETKRKNGDKIFVIKRYRRRIQRLKTNDRYSSIRNRNTVQITFVDNVTICFPISDQIKYGRGGETSKAADLARDVTRTDPW